MSEIGPKVNCPLNVIHKPASLRTHDVFAKKGNYSLSSTDNDLGTFTTKLISVLYKIFTLAFKRPVIKNTNEIFLDLAIQDGSWFF